MFIALRFAEVASSNLNIFKATEKNSLSVAAGNIFHVLQIHWRVIMKLRKDIPTLSLCRYLGLCLGMDLAV